MKTKKNTRKILVKVMALILCALMLLGTFVSIIPILGEDHSDHDHSSSSSTNTGLTVDDILNSMGGESTDSSTSSSENGH